MDRWKLASISLALVACTIALATASYVALGSEESATVEYENEGNSDYRGITPEQKDIEYNEYLHRPVKGQGPV